MRSSLAGGPSSEDVLGRFEVARVVKILRRSRLKTPSRKFHLRKVQATCHTLALPRNATSFRSHRNPRPRRRLRYPRRPPAACPWLGSAGLRQKCGKGLLGGWDHSPRTRARPLAAGMPLRGSCFPIEIAIGSPGRRANSPSARRLPSRSQADPRPASILRR